MNTNEIIKGMKEKPYFELSEEEKSVIPAIMKKLALSEDEKNSVFLGLMFNETIFTALSKVR